MARTFGNREPMTMARGLRLILAAQVVVAGLLLLTDMGTRWRFDAGAVEGVPAAPVSPGDQVRQYEPGRSLPRFVDPALLRDRPFPADLPRRLEFAVTEDPDFGPMLTLHGGIEAGDARRLDAFLAGLDAVPPLAAMNSPGGDVDEALRIGRLLRERELDTLIPAGAACFSACPYALAGGVERRVSAQGSVGLHQHYYDAPGYMPVYFAVEDIQRNQGETMAYLIEMGVDPGVMVHGLSTPPQEIYVLVEEELIDSRLATAMVD